MMIFRDTFRVLMNDNIGGWKIRLDRRLDFVRDAMRFNKRQGFVEHDVHLDELVQSGRSRCRSLAWTSADLRVPSRGLDDHAAVGFGVTPRSMRALTDALAMRMALTNRNIAKYRCRIPRPPT